MKILVVTPFLPYAGATHAGGVSVYELIKRLSGVGHEVTLLARVSKRETEHIDDAKRICRDVECFYFDARGFVPLVISYVALGRRANALMRDRVFDIVVAEHTETGVAICRPLIPSALVAHDAVSKAARNRFKSADGVLKKIGCYAWFAAMKALERRIVQKFAMVLAMSEAEKRWLCAMVPNADVRVSTNLLDLRPGFDGKRNIEAHSMLFYGAMSRRVNAEAALYLYDKVFPVVRKQFPDAKFYVVGNKPPQELVDLAAGDKGLIVTGFVEDEAEYFLRAAVFVSPLFTGGGIIVKNLQAMSYGVPVVTTAVGNEGIGAADGKEIIVANDGAAMADAVMRIFDDPWAGDALAAAAKAFAVKNFAADVLFARRLSLYEELASVGYRGNPVPTP